MNVRQLKQYTERPKSDIENFLELAEKIEAKVAEFNKGFKDNNVVVIGRDAEPTLQTFKYFIDFKPAGADGQSRHEIDVWFNYARLVSKFEFEEHKLHMLATKGDYCYLTQKRKVFKKDDDMYCDEDTWSNSVTIRQKVRSSRYALKHEEEENRKWFKVGRWDDSKQFKNHDKIIKCLFKKLEAKRDRMYRDYDYCKENRDRTAIHDIMEKDAPSMNMVAKERTTFNRECGEMSPLRMNESMLPSNNVTCYGEYKYSDKYKLTVTFDDLSYDELKTMCINTEDLFSAYTSATGWCNNLGNDNV